MAIAHDTQTRFPATDGPSGTNSVDTTTGNRTFSHAGSASAKGAVVVLCSTTTTTTVSGVLYGGAAMTLKIFEVDTTEAGRVEVWVLTDGVPTGTQTVTLQGCTATGKWATCSTVTATNAVYVDASDAVTTTISADPQITLPTFGTTMVYGGVHSGAAAPPIVPFSGYSVQFRNDYGALSASTLRATSPIAAGTVIPGYTQASDDWCMAGVALAEATHVAAVTITSTMAVGLASRESGPLAAADIVQVNQGTITDAVGFVNVPVTLPVAAGYGNAVIVCCFIAGTGLQLFTPTLADQGADFVRDSPAASGTERVYVFRRAPVGVGESSWNMQAGTAPTTIEWVALEVAGLDPSATVDAVSTYTTGSAPSISPAIPDGLSYDNFQLAVLGARNSANTTIPTWGGYDPAGFAELAEQGAVQGAEALAIGVAGRFPASAAGVTVSATATDAVTLAAVALSYASKTRGVFGQADSGQARVEATTDPTSGGVIDLTVTTVPNSGVALTWEESGTPTTVNVPPDTVQTEVLNAPDEATVNSIEVVSDADAPERG